MGRGQASDGEVAEAMADAIIRTIHHAPESLLARLGGPTWRPAARRMAIRVVIELAGDGWGVGLREGWGPCGASSLHDGLHRSIEAGLATAGEHLRAMLPEIRAVNGSLLDGVGKRLAGAVVAAMVVRGVGLGKLTRAQLAVHQSGRGPLPE
jgi:hypothetical protein